MYRWGSSDIFVISREKFWGSATSKIHVLENGALRLVRLVTGNKIVLNID